MTMDWIMSLADGDKKKCARTTVNKSVLTLLGFFFEIRVSFYSLRLFFLHQLTNRWIESALLRQRKADKRLFALKRLHYPVITGLE